MYSGIKYNLRIIKGKKCIKCENLISLLESYRDVGPLVEGPGDVYICGECIELCQSILDQERKRRGTSKQLFTKVTTPRQIVNELDEYVIGQDTVA